MFKTLHFSDRPSIVFGSPRSAHYTPSKAFEIERLENKLQKLENNTVNDSDWNAKHTYEDNLGDDENPFWVTEYRSSADDELHQISKLKNKIETMYKELELTF